MIQGDDTLQNIVDEKVDYMTFRKSIDSQLTEKRKGESMLFSQNNPQFVDSFNNLRVGGS
jgi:hypothetical protein